jgi:hypothetical protein
MWPAGLLEHTSLKKRVQFSYTILDKGVVSLKRWTFDPREGNPYPLEKKLSGTFDRYLRCSEETFVILEMEPALSSP